MSLPIDVWDGRQHNRGGGRGQLDFVGRADYCDRVSPTVFRDGPFRFFFFSREESRIHIHVLGPDGEAKFWLEPKVSLVYHAGFSSHELL
jgi:hypothetical protein